MLVDSHTHFVPPLADHADRLGDPRWPTFAVDGPRGRLVRDGRTARSVPITAWSAAARVEHMDRHAIRQQVLSPLPPLLCDWAVGAAATRWYEQINEGIATVVGERPDRFLGVGCVPLQDPDRAVQVLASAAAAGLTGVQVGTTAGGRELDHPDLREFFRAAAELDVVVVVHPLILGPAVDWTDRIDGAELAFGLGMPTDTAIAAARLVFGGVAEECPDLRIHLAHGGGSFAWVLPRIARLWDPTHDTTAVQLAAGVHVDTVVYEPANVEHLCRVLGPGRVTWGTDFPLPAQDEQTGALLAGLSPEDRRQVSGENARRLFARAC